MAVSNRYANSTANIYDYAEAGKAGKEGSIDELVGVAIAREAREEVERDEMFGVLVASEAGEKEKIEHPRGESFLKKKFGLVFRIIIVGEETRASVIEDPSMDLQYRVGTFEGRAVPHEDDVYDRRIGVLAAIKHSYATYKGFLIGEVSRTLQGMQNERYTALKEMYLKINRMLHEQHNT